MLLDPIDAPEETTAEDLHLAYLEELAAVVSDVGVDEAADRTEIPADVLTALVSGEHPDLVLDDAAAILALTDEWPDADVVMLEIRDSIMLGMSSAVLDVDALERELDDGLDAKTIQQMIEGRRPMPLAEYAAIALTIERENDYA
ncbi:MAG: DUF5791 family protein [Halobacteriota archaeon]